MTSEANDSSPTGPSRRSFLAGAAVIGAAAGVEAARAASPNPGSAPVNPRLFSFVGGKAGPWSVIESKAVSGEGLPAVERMDIVQGLTKPAADGPLWVLHGVTSNERYVTREEKDQLVKKQVAIGRADVNRMAVIPIRKNAKWWALTQDERRAIFEDQSHHNRIGLKYLPAVARRLHHCRDLTEPEPFDFITLFDYAEADSKAFEDLVAALRATEEWKYVDREVDIRLERVKAP